MPLTKPANFLLVPILSEWPCSEIKILRLGPSDPLEQRNEHNTENTGTMLASPAVQQHITASSQMHDHEQQDGSHMLVPTSAIEPPPLLDVQPTMLPHVLQHVRELFLGAIHNCVSVGPRPKFGVLCLAHKKLSTGGIAPDAPRHGTPEQQEHQTEH